VNSHADLEAYVLGALDLGEAAAFESHLVACPDCREGVASYSVVVRGLRTLPVSAPPPSPAPRLRRPRMAFIAAVAAAAIVGVAVVQRNDGGGTDADLAAIAQMVADRRHEVALAGPAAHGSAIVGAGGRRTAFIVDGLPAPAAGRGYQVWVRGSRVRSPGMLHRTSTGLEVLVVPGDALAGARTIGITVEPAGGSAARTGPPQVTGALS
jgi:anti-sigma-K factor RskA